MKPASSDAARRAMSWHPPLMLFAFTMLVTALLSAAGVLLDARTLVGAPIWWKPFKFAVSFGAYALSWAWMISLQRRSRGIAYHCGTIIACAGAIEMLIIIAQVLRGQRSHFNYATPFDTALWVTMQCTVAVLWFASLALAILLLRKRAVDTSYDRASLWAIRLGVLISLPGMSLAGLMTNPTPQQSAALRTGAVLAVIGAHSVGVPEGGPSLPLTGWSTTGGDLRIPHFVGLHALQFLPLFGMVLRVFSARVRMLRDHDLRLRLVWLGGATYAGGVALLTWQALRGQPLFEPDTWTLLAVGCLSLAAALASSWILFGARVTAQPEPVIVHTPMRQP